MFNSKSDEILVDIIEIYCVEVKRWIIIFEHKMTDINMEEQLRERAAWLPER